MYFEDDATMTYRYRLTRFLGTLSDFGRKNVMNVWEELAKEYFERNYPESEYVDIFTEEQKDINEQKDIDKKDKIKKQKETKRQEIDKIKEQVVHRLNILTDGYFGDKRFVPISSRQEELDAEKEEKFHDTLEKYLTRIEKIESQQCEYKEKMKKLKQEIELAKKEGALTAEKEKNFKELQGLLDKLNHQHDDLEGKYFNAAMGIEEKERFAELNDLEKELFGILLNEIRQADLWKMRHNKWEEFPLDMRNRIVELLDRLCDEEQWKAVGTGMELNIELIKYKLLYPREYRLIKVAEMLVSDVILQEMKDNVLEKMDKSIFSAYKQLLKVDVMDNIERLAEEGFEDAVERLLKKNKK